MTKVFRWSVFQFFLINSFLGQNSGLLKPEKITTYWNKEKQQIRSIGTYHTNGYSKIGAKSGNWIHYFKNGTIQEISNYYKGALNGVYKSYYINGNLKIKTFYTLGKVDSTFEAYYFNGNLAEKGKYTIRPNIFSKDTLTLDYWIHKNELLSSNKTGIWKYYYEKGTLMEKTYFLEKDSIEYIDLFIDIAGDTIIKDGEGIRKSYYPSQKIKSLVEYKNGLENGLYKLFKPNGKVRKKGEYINGEKSGKWMESFLTNDSTYQLVEFTNWVKE